MAYFLTKNSKYYVFFLSKILNFPRIRSLVGVKIAHLETKKSKNFRRLSPAYFLIVCSDFQGEAAKKMAHFLTKNSKNDVFFLPKILNFPSKRRKVGVKIAHLETKKNQKIFAGCRRHIFLLSVVVFKGKQPKKWPTLNKKSKNFAGCRRHIFL